jgi:hypothetical protein
MSQRNDPVVRELIALLEQARAKSQAILDNCWEDQSPADPRQAMAQLEAIRRNLIMARDWARSEAQPAGAKP